MKFQKAKYAGDEMFCVDSTGDCCVGDIVRFERATFSGSFRSPRFAGFEMVTGQIVDDSYGYQKQQHTFSIKTENGDIFKIKGRNLYRNRVFRKVWADEALRNESLDEKHARGELARSERVARKNQYQ